ncbi:hypothetical protein [uncultured Dechloromonas sp.]|uniref:hypothetical protein n=1 Tax=uncultured Dechloromonas sp. TaxID=171719 RepID=UPI0025DCB64A|nr:hypothetical protein [uncultured Dechloromonas sp.]
MLVYGYNFFGKQYYTVKPDTWHCSSPDRDAQQHVAALLQAGVGGVQLGLALALKHLFQLRYRGLVIGNGRVTGIIAFWEIEQAPPR